MAGANCDLQNRIGWTPLHFSVLGMHHQVPALNWGAPHSFCLIVSWESGLHCADCEHFERMTECHGSTVQVMERLCLNGMAQPNIGCTRTVKMKVDVGNGTVVDFQCVQGDTPAHFAARLGYFMCMKICLDNGGIVATQNNRKQTAMHVALATVDKRLIELMLEYGDDCMALEDDEGNDPVDACNSVIVAHMGQDKDSVAKQLAVQEIKSLLNKAAIARSKAAHHRLIEEAKLGISRRRNEVGGDAEDEDEGNEVEKMQSDVRDVESDGKSMQEKLSSMAVELKAARAEARQAQHQSRLKTHSLNEVLLETKRRLAEAEYMLQKERETRAGIERELLGLAYGDVAEGGTASWRGASQGRASLSSRSGLRGDTPPQVMRLESARLRTPVTEAEEERLLREREVLFEAEEPQEDLVATLRSFEDDTQ
jgi:hypothetical protein